MGCWLVTGCSTGIGRAIAEEALTRGEHVAVTARDVSAVADLAENHPGRALALRLDVTDRDTIRDAVQQTVSGLGEIDVLVNNAGYGYLSALEEGEDEDVRRLFDTNFFGVVDVVKAVLPSMRARRSGHIVNISSMTGLVANPPNLYYSCSKFALEALTECLAKEVRPFGVRVSAVEPGAVLTDWASRSMQRPSRTMTEYADTVGARRDLITGRAEQLAGDPLKVARAVVDLVEHPDPPLRLLLGRDVLAAARQKLTEMSESIDAWESITTGIDRDPTT